MSHDERRIHPRRPVTLLVEYPNARELQQDYTANLSEGGAFVLTDREFALGTQVDLVLSFPGLLHPISISGEVRWSGKDPEAGVPGVGIQFANLDDETKERLLRLIDALAQGQPGLVADHDFRLLLIEDNHHLADLIARGLSLFGRNAGLTFSIDIVANGADARQRVGEGHYDALIVDLYTPVVSGVDFIGEVRARRDSTPIIAMSGGRSGEERVARDAGSDAFLAKPFRLNDLISALSQLVEGVPAP